MATLFHELEPRGAHSEAGAAAPVRAERLKATCIRAWLYLSVILERERDSLSLSYGFSYITRVAPHCVNTLMITL